MHLLQLSTAVPSYRYPNEEMIELFLHELPDEVKQNVLNLGVSSRHFACPIDFSIKSEFTSNDAEPVLEISVAACRLALESSGLQSKDIDYLIVTYDSSAFLCPALSNLLLSKLGFKPDTKHVSIQGMACAAFIRSLQLAEDHLAKFPQSRVMISLSGVNSYWFYNQVKGIKDVKGIREIQTLKNNDQKSREMRKWIAIIEFFLFGDGSACLIVANQGNGPQPSDMVSITNLRQLDYLAGYARLTCSNEPFKFGFHSYLDKSIPELGVEYTSVVLEKLLHGKDPEFKAGAKKWIVHTGSKRILNHIAQSHSLAYETIKESHEILANYGNLAGASLPFILEKIIREGKLGTNDYAIMLGYGWGFTANGGLIIF
jgi:polyketide synthase Type III